MCEIYIKTNGKILAENEYYNSKKERTSINEYEGWVRNEKLLSCHNFYCDNECSGNTIILYYENIEGIRLCKNCIKDRDNIVKRLIKYDIETYKDIIVRSTDVKEWVFKDYCHDRVTVDDINCIFGSDTCWFHGNLDRLNEYDGYYSLKNTDDEISMCRVCWDNDGMNDYKVEKCIKQKFMTKEEKETQINEKLQQLLPKYKELISLSNKWEVTSHSHYNNKKCVFNNSHTFDDDFMYILSIYGDSVYVCSYCKTKNVAKNMEKLALHFARGG